VEFPTGEGFRRLPDTRRRSSGIPVGSAPERTWDRRIATIQRVGYENDLFVVGGQDVEDR
jgi:hypothetical protein